MAGSTRSDALTRTRRLSGPRLRVLVVTLTLLVLAACGSDGEGGDTRGADGSTTTASGATGDRIKLKGSDGLIWGDGAYGVVLAHGAAFDAASWEAQASAMAAQGATVVAVEDISPEGILAGVAHLRDELDVRDVALVGGSAGADAILAVASQQPNLPDQLILLSPNATVGGLGREPKLLIASEGEPLADVSRQLARVGPGDENEVEILPGSAHAQNIFDTDQGEAATRMILGRLREFASR